MRRRAGAAARARGRRRVGAAALGHLRAPRAGRCAGTARVLPLVVGRARVRARHRSPCFPTLRRRRRAARVVRAAHGLLDAVRSWPFAWLDSDLSTAGPTARSRPRLAGRPGALVVAGIYAVTRNERRELGVLVGMVVAVLVGMVAALVRPRRRASSCSSTPSCVLAPLLAALVVRGVSLAARTRRIAPRRRCRALGRARPSGPRRGVRACCSIAATGTTGSRMVHAPGLLSVSLRPGTRSSRAAIRGCGTWSTGPASRRRARRRGRARSRAPAGRRAALDRVRPGYGKSGALEQPGRQRSAAAVPRSTGLDAYQARLFYNRDARRGRSTRRRRGRCASRARVAARSREQRGQRHAAATAPTR